MVLHTQKNHLITQKTQTVAFAIHALGMAIKMK